MDVEHENHRRVLFSPSIDNDQKEQAERTIANVREDIVERREHGELSCAEKIEIAKIFVTRGIDVQLKLKNQLNDR